MVNLLNGFCSAVASINPHHSTHHKWWVRGADRNRRARSRQHKLTKKREDSTSSHFILDEFIVQRLCFCKVILMKRLQFALCKKIVISSYHLRQALDSDVNFFCCEIEFCFFHVFHPFCH